MGRVSGILVILLLGGGAPGAGAADLPLGCRVEAGSVVSSMPPLRRQDGSDFCYAFAATALVQNLYCEERRAAGKPCRFGAEADDRLSILDIINTGNFGDERGGGILSGGDTEDVLSNLGRKGTAARESCAPFDALVNSITTSFGSKCSSAPKGPFEQFHWRKVLRHFYACYQKPDPCPCKDSVATRQRRFAEEIKGLLDLRTSVEEIQEALTFRREGLFAAKALIPRACEQTSQRVSLPAYRVETQPVVLAKRDSKQIRADIRAKLDSLLAGPVARPVTAYLCMNGGSRHDSALRCGPHALVVSGVRELCCGKTCTHQYRIHDSASTFGAPRPGEDQWVREEALLERMESYLTLTPGIPSGKSMVWIEKEGR